MATGTSAAQQVLDAALAKLTQTHGGEQQALSGYTKEILGYLKGTPKAIAGDYQGAINQQNGFANQYAAQQRAANPNAQIQHDLRSVNAPPEQIAALKAQLHAAYGGSAANLFALGGAIPNSAFAADKAANLAFARSLPAIEGLRGQQLFTQLLANQGKESQALQSQKADLLYKEQANRDSLAARTSYGPGSTKAPTTRSFRDGTTRQYNPQSGKWDVLARSSAKGASSNPSLSIKRGGDAGTSALNKLTAKVWNATPGSTADPKADPDSYAIAQKNAHAQLQKSFGSAMYRVITAVAPHLKAAGYSRQQIRMYAFQLVSSTIDPPAGYAQRHGYLKARRNG